MNNLNRAVLQNMDCPLASPTGRIFHYTILLRFCQEKNCTKFSTIFFPKKIDEFSPMRYNNTCKGDNKRDWKTTQTKKIKKMLTKRNKNDIIIISNKGSEKNKVATKKIKK